MNEVPPWFKEHIESDARNFDDIRNSLARIEVKLNPIWETYTDANTFGQWIMRSAVFISIILGIVLGFKGFFK